MTKKKKFAQPTRAGYEYQDLICLELLLGWFKSPEKYQWVKIESDENKSLNDVVALGKDDTYHLCQVKFTLDSERDDLSLSFNWLLTKKGKGKSLLQKWANDVFQYNEKNILSSAALKTNRVPDSEFLKCLQGNKIDVSLIPAQTLENINVALGGSEKSKSFFDNFIFEHSLREKEDLETALHDSVVPDHATEYGWLQIKDLIKSWAIAGNGPVGDGCIKFDRLHSILTFQTGPEISQDFAVPPGYSPPTKAFHQEILDKTQSSGGWIIYGRPGMGKSTYLSYLTNFLSENGKPVIRHHYSLYPTPDMYDRSSFGLASNSLIRQLELQFPSLFPDHTARNNHDLESSVEKVINKLSESNEILTVIIDGLDHVGRERSDISQLEHLINRLINFRDKTCLIFGTQPVESSSLPNTISLIPIQNRINLPCMDINSITNWIGQKLTDQEIGINGGLNKEKEILEISEALLNVSKGYPLHLVYSVRNLIAANKTLDKYIINKLPACPDGDIHTYYQTLWSNLKDSAKRVLLLIGCAEFSWPNKNAIACCFDNSLEFANSYGEIQHLIEERRSGIVVFHSSLIVFIQNTQEFNSDNHSLQICIKKWLDESAPEYWKWGWDWVVDAKLGNSDPLIKGITRNWVIDSVCKGYPLQYVENIIAAAEKYTFERKLWSELVRIRLIRGRLVNGPEFQVQDFAKFLKCSLKNSDEDHGLLWRLDNLKSLDEKEIAVVSTASRKFGKQVTKECFEEIEKRLSIYSRTNDETLKSKISSLIDSALEILTNVNDPEFDQIFNFLSHCTNKPKVFAQILDCLIASNNRSSILKIPTEHISKNLKNIYLDQYVLACCEEGILLSDLPTKDEFKSVSLGVIKLALEGDNVGAELLVNPTTNNPKKVGRKYFYDKFFFSLARQIKNLKEPKTPYELEIDDLESYVKKANKVVEYAAFCIAKLILGKEEINVFEIYDHLNKSGLFDHKKSFEFAQIQSLISTSLTKISLDLYLLLLSGKLKKINHDSLDKLHENKWWSAFYWLQESSLKSISISKEIKEKIIEQSIEALKVKRENITNLANEAIDIANLASELNLRKLSIQAANLSAQHIMGYGWRKDIRLAEVYDVMEACSEHGVGNISNWLERLAPFTNDVSDFSEREIRQIPGQFMNLLSKHSPERLVDEFDYSLKNEHWAIVDHIFESIVQNFNLDTLAEVTFLKSLSSKTAMLQLEERSRNEGNLKIIYDEQYKFLGGLSLSRKEGDSTSSIKKNSKIDVTSYRPDQLGELYQALKPNAFYDVEDGIKSWIEYWDSNNEGCEVIKSFSAIYDNDPDFAYKVRPCLKTIFSLSHRFQGKTEAYKWAVQAVIHNNYWNPFWGGSEQLKEYAKIYSLEWEKLLIDTTKELIRPRVNPWITVPTEKLVLYLLNANQYDLACEIVEAMVSSIESETSHLPLSESHWYEKVISKEEIVPRILLLYYSRWPDRFLRIRIANQIANLLENDITFRSLYLKHLSQLKYEVQICDLLSILTLTSTRIFSLDELLPNIHYPSLLSEIILQKIGYSYISLKPKYYSEIDIKSCGSSFGFEKAKDGIAPIYLNLIRRLGKLINYDLTKRFGAEWEIISSREELCFFDPYNFCSDLFYRQDKLSCSLSSHTESIFLSAYLRAIAFANENFSLPKEEILEAIMIVESFGGLITKLQPSSEPTNWPTFLEKTEDDIKLPTKDDLENYLKNFLKENEVILAANGPISTGFHKVFCDLEVRMIFSIKDITSGAENTYELLKNMTTPIPGVPHFVAPNLYLHPGKMGRYEIDFMLRGFAVPEFTVGSPFAIKDIKLDCVNYIAGNVRNGTWRYWTSNWYPASHSGMGSSIGTYLTSSKNILKMIQKEIGGSFYLLGKLSSLDRRKYQNSYPIETTFALTKLDLSGIDY